MTIALLLLVAAILLTGVAGVVVLVIWLVNRSSSMPGPPSKPTGPSQGAAICSRCGMVLPVGAPQGLCPRCVMRIGLDTQTGEAGAVGPHGTKIVPPAKEDLAQRFPNLEIMEQLGQGGMGTVYKARQPKLNRLVALKILAPEKGADPRFAERFLREAQALARLNHPNIVSVYDYGEAEGMFFLVMEYVDGATLRRVLQEGRMKPEEALTIVPPICEALHFAHEQGVVHRDIKPENILIDVRGRVKVADFGIAKIVGKEQRAAGLTEEGSVIGTPHYMAPEQIEKPQLVDHRADIYSLGVVLYEMLTGELPLGRFQPPSKQVSVDVRLDEIVLRALEKEPERRYQHVSHVKTDVENISSGSPGPVDSSQKSPAEQGGTAAPHFSRTAISGAAWVLCFILAGWFLTVTESTGSRTAKPVWETLLNFTLLPLGATAPIGATVLGCVAISRIRRSAGRVRGMPLAVFSALLFPLLAFDALIVWLGMGVKLGFGEAVALCVPIDGFLIWMVWRSLHPPRSNVVRRLDWLPAAGSIALVAVICAGLFLKVMVTKSDRARANLEKQLQEQVGELLAENRITYSRMHFEYSPVLPRALVTFTKLEGWRNRTNGEPLSAASSLHLAFDTPGVCVVSGRGDLSNIQRTIFVPDGKALSWPHRVGPMEDDRLGKSGLAPKTGFAATLPDGSFVELVSIMYGSTPRRTPGQTNSIDFWNPDGTRLDHDLGWSFGPSNLGSRRDPALDYRMFVVRWGGPDGNTPRLMGWQIEDHPQDSVDGQFTVNPKGESAENWIGLGQGFPREQKTANLRFALASGPYMTGPGSNMWWSSSGTTPFGSYSIGKIFDHNGNAAVTLTHNLKNCDYRLRVTVDRFPKPKSRLGGFIWEWKEEFRRGERYQAVEGRVVKGGAFNPIFEFPDVSAKDAMARLPRIHFEVRPARWMEFRNVALNPGEKTGLQVLADNESVGNLPTESSLTFRPVMNGP